MSSHQDIGRHQLGFTRYLVLTNTIDHGRANLRYDVLRFRKVFETKGSSWQLGCCEAQMPSCHLAIRIWLTPDISVSESELCVPLGL